MPCSVEVCALWVLLVVVVVVIVVARCHNYVSVDNKPFSLWPTRWPNYYHIDYINSKRSVHLWWLYLLYHYVYICTFLLWMFSVCMLALQIVNLIVTRSVQVRYRRTALERWNGPPVSLRLCILLLNVALTLLVGWQEEHPVCEKI